MTGQRIATATVPDGVAGTREVLKLMRREVQQGCKDTRNLWLARSITAGLPNKAWIREIRAIFEWVRKNIRYSLDPDGFELLQGAQKTIELGAGDCDDMCILLGTLLKLSGHPSWLLAVGFSEHMEFSHVLIQTRGAGETRIISLDATEPEPMGWFPPGVTCTMRADL